MLKAAKNGYKKGIDYGGPSLVQWQINAYLKKLNIGGFRLFVKQIILNNIFLISWFSWF